jgi:hypothetical protein
MKNLIHERWHEQQSRGVVTPLCEPPESFCEWWQNHDHCPKRIRGRGGHWGYTSGITAYKAWQMQCYQDEFAARRHENASGTGVNYAFTGTYLSDPAMDGRYQFVKDFNGLKNIVGELADKFNMNKAIGWTEEDSEKANAEGGAL